jgi:hypothetical protein
MTNEKMKLFRMKKLPEIFERRQYKEGFWGLTEKQLNKRYPLK